MLIGDGRLSLQNLLRFRLVKPIRLRMQHVRAEVPCLLDVPSCMPIRSSLRYIAIRITITCQSLPNVGWLLLEVLPLLFIDVGDRLLAAERSSS